MYMMEKYFFEVNGRYDGTSQDFAKVIVILPAFCIRRDVNF